MFLFRITVTGDSPKVSSWPSLGVALGGGGLMTETGIVFFTIPTGFFSVALWRSAGLAWLGVLLLSCC